MKKFYIILLFALTNCVFNNQKDQFETIDFKETQILNSKILNINYPYFVSFWDLKIIDDYIIGYNLIDKDNYLIHVFDKNSNVFLKSAILIGGAANEINVPGTIFCDYLEKELYIQDAGRFDYLIVNIDSLLNYDQYIPTKRLKQIPAQDTFLYTRREKLNNNFVQAGMDSENLLTFTDINGNIINRIGSHFIKKEGKDDFSYNKLMEHNFAKHPAKYIYAVSYSFFNKILVIDSIGNEICQFNGKEKIIDINDSKSKEYHFSPAFSKRAYYGIQCDENYIYAKFLNNSLYVEGNKERYMGNEIHVFDWNCNPILKLKLSNSIDYNFAINENKLIGIDQNSEYSLIEFDLSETTLY